MMRLIYLCAQHTMIMILSLIVNTILRVVTLSSHNGCISASILKLEMSVADWMSQSGAVQGRSHLLHDFEITEIIHKSLQNSNHLNIK